jgi:hypothetical protein
MEMRDLLEKMMKFAGEKVGQKPGEQWRGDDPNPPGKKLVGGSEQQEESILKDLSKGPKAKTCEQELAEEFEAFLQSLDEENLGTHPKRPGRTSDRHPRGHEPHPRYKTVKEIAAPEIEFQKQQALRKHEDETADVGMFTGAETGFGALNAARSARKRAKAKDDDEIDEAANPAQQAAIAIAMKKAGKKPKNEGAMSEKDIELQDYRSMSHKEFQNAYGMSKTEWINKNKSLVIQNPSIKKALGLEEAVGQTYTVVIDRKGRQKPVSGTMEELLDYFGYTLETGKSYEHEKGRYKINLNPKNIVQLVDALNKAATNAAANSAPSTYYSVGEEQVNESHYKWEITFRNGKRAVYHRGEPGYTDQTIASDIEYTKKSNPGSTIVATKDGKPFDWQSLLSEGWESGPEEYEEPYDDADDAYDRQRQEKIDTEAEKEWAKLPKVSTYKLVGRGPNMEPNYEFGDEFDSLEQALKYREEIMKDPKTPHPEHIGIRTLTRLAD